jgi:hypothetical protein
LTLTSVVYGALTEAGPVPTALIALTSTTSQSPPAGLLGNPVKVKRFPCLIPEMTFVSAGVAVQLDQVAALMLDQEAVSVSNVAGESLVACLNRYSYPVMAEPLSAGGMKTISAPPLPARVVASSGEAGAPATKTEEPVETGSEVPNRFLALTRNV